MRQNLIQDFNTMTEAQIECQHCGCDDLTEELTPDMNHHGKRVCMSCHGFNGWLPKPDKDKTKRPASHKRLAKKLGNGFCEMCLLDSDNLEGHHVIPYKNDGDSHKDNVWILCVPCHKLIHHTRTYHGTNDRSTDRT